MGVLRGRTRSVRARAGRSGGGLGWKIDNRERAASHLDIVPVGEAIGLVIGTAAAVAWGRLVPAVFIGFAVLVGLAATSWQQCRLTDSPRRGLRLILVLFAIPTNVAIAGYLALGREGPAVEAAQSGIIALSVFLLVRIVPFVLIRWRLRNGVGMRRALIVGSDKIGVHLAGALERRSDLGVTVRGFVDDVQRPAAGGWELLGRIDSLPEIVRRESIDLVILAFPARTDGDLIDPIRAVGRHCEIYLVPEVFDLRAQHREFETVDGIPLVRLMRRPFRALSWQMKRLLDIVVASLVLIALAPILGITAVAVRRETGPGVIFKQVRIGLDGRPFTLYKFRSLAPAEGEGDVKWNIDEDPRLGRVGRIIRATGIDELPQLFNVLKGDMSLVGPRPERPFYVEQFSATVPGYRHRHRVPAGLTGFAVVHGLRGDTSIRDRSDFDNLYAESWSLWLDIKIMMRTGSQIFPAVVRRSRSKCSK